LKLSPHHVLLFVSDINRAVDFYTEVRGLQLSKSQGFSMVGGKAFWVSLHLSPKSVAVHKRGDAGFLVLKPDISVPRSIS